MFLAEIRKIMYTPVNSSFTLLKWGLRGLKLYRYVFLMINPSSLGIVRSCTQELLQSLNQTISAAKVENSKKGLENEPVNINCEGGDRNRV